ncbi:hypothetical protein NQD34_004662 [Periophthalmus magnuspinnatus]|nr:hypothetical protein NQD34_004662 [Periophthalmus magnuspinnatus]
MNISRHVSDGSFCIHNPATHMTPAKNTKHKSQTHRLVKCLALRRKNSTTSEVFHISNCPFGDEYQLYHCYPNATMEDECTETQKLQKHQKIQDYWLQLTIQHTAPPTAFRSQCLPMSFFWVEKTAPHRLHNSGNECGVWCAALTKSNQEFAGFHLCYIHISLDFTQALYRPTVGQVSNRPWSVTLLSNRNTDKSLPANQKL